MRFATRAFAFCFIPFALVLGISFWALQSRVQRSVHEELRSGMRDKQKSMASNARRNELQVSRILRFASENYYAEGRAAVFERGTRQARMRGIRSKINCGS